MLLKILFVLYAGAIPLVPLLGAQKYKKDGNDKKRFVCMLVFAVQTLISFGSIIEFIK